MQLSSHKGGEDGKQGVAAKGGAKSGALSNGGGVSERPEPDPDLPASGPESPTLDPGRHAPENAPQTPAHGPQQHLVADAPDALPAELIELWATLDPDQRQALLAGLRRLVGKGP